MIGITAYGVYLPRFRLARLTAAKAMGWLNPALGALARGERAVAHWDEDAITMAVAAARRSLDGVDKKKLDGLFMASTSLPFADRQNAGVTAAALNLGHALFTADVSGSQKAGTSAVLKALNAVEAGRHHRVLVAAADIRPAPVASPQAMLSGDGAASVIVGHEAVLAEFMGSWSSTVDLVDHFRRPAMRFDATGEGRWVRDTGYLAIIPEAIARLLQHQQVTLDQIAQLIYPCPVPKFHREIARRLGADDAQVADPMHGVCGETGCAHPLMMLAAALDRAEPGDRLLMVGFGQGCDALLWRVTDNITPYRACHGLARRQGRPQKVSNYLKWLKFRALLADDPHQAAQPSAPASLAVLHRHRPMLLGLEGGWCRRCGTPQYPRTAFCVNPHCRAQHTQQRHEFADKAGILKTFTGDYLSPSIDPPALYGMVDFDGGGRMLLDITDCELAELTVGQRVRLCFRRKRPAAEVELVSYFWKAAPV